MNTALRKQLHQLTRKQQHKLWFNRIIARLSLPLWWSVSILFIGGCIHQLLAPLAPMAVAAIAFLPSLIFLFWISNHVKPLAEEGAAEADRLFSANSLFVSAWELSQSAANIQGIDHLLLARCERELPAWSLQLKKQPQSAMTPITLAATTLALIGLFFLLQPAHQQSNKPTAEISSKASPAASSTMTAASLKEIPEQKEDAADVLSKLFSEETNTVEQQHPQNTTQGNKLQSSTQNNQPVSESNKDNSLTAERTNKQLSAQSSTFPQNTPQQHNAPQDISAHNKGKKIADRSAGNQAAIKNTDSGTNEQTVKRKDFADRNLIDIDTGNDQRNTAFDSSAKGNELIITSPEQTTKRQMMGRDSLNKTRTNAGTLLTAEQRTLVWRYFKQLEKNNESN